MYFHNTLKVLFKYFVPPSGVGNAKACVVNASSSLSMTCAAVKDCFVPRNDEREKGIARIIKAPEYFRRFYLYFVLWLTTISQQRITSSVLRVRL